MSKEKTYKITEGERLFFRLSKSGRGVYITSENEPFGLRGNFEHVKAVLKGQKDFAVLEVVSKSVFKNGAEIERGRVIEEDW